ncbi:MAG TPA: WecB/TagA/CpsF family glycosyltransferase [Clostridiaceae bacterium]|nr:WecB/TagA/CpsF family glycosyltransferase [Clostridiaceae bacterium]
MRNTVEILGVRIDKVTMNEALQKLQSFLQEDRVHTIYTPNSEIMMAAQRDEYLKDILNSADLLVADGAGVVLASRILKVNLPEKVAGFDLVRNSFSMEASKKTRYFLFGSKPGVAEAAKEKILNTYKNVEIAGCYHGYFSPEDEDNIIDMINRSGADILLVALGAPKQEKWIHENKDKLKVKVCIGVGGSLDVLSGNVKLAPEFFRRNGLEWLYRLYKEPRRFKRMLDLPRFILRVIWKRLTKA